MTKQWAIRAGYLSSFAISYAAAWNHVLWLALLFFGIAFFYLSRTHING